MARYRSLMFHGPRGGNRYFATYYNTAIAPRSEYIEILQSASGPRLASHHGNPRNTPMYVNISHNVSNNLIQPLTRPVPPRSGASFEDIILSARPVPFFEDKICDGYVGASLSVPGNNPLYAVVDRGVLNAFSIITAPDFFPQADEFDLQAFDIAPGSGSTSLFYEGGIASLANLSIRPNPPVYINDPAALQSANAPETYTTVIANHHAAGMAGFNDPQADNS